MFYTKKIAQERKLRNKFFLACSHKGKFLNSKNVNMHKLFNSFKKKLSLDIIEYIGLDSYISKKLLEVSQMEDGQEKCIEVLDDAIKNYISPGIYSNKSPRVVNWQYAKFHKLEEQPFVDITIACVRVADNEYYPFNGTVIGSIWFSTNPELFMPRHIQESLIQRRKDVPNAKLNLVYSSKILSDKSCKEMEKLALRYNLQLVDVDSIKSYNALLDIVKQELSLLGAGGNPAAASDLCRWIPEIFNEGMYVDIDIPIVKDKVRPTFRGGLPIMLNTGSIISTPMAPTYRSEEAICINTDIIAYSNNNTNKLKMMNHVTEYITSLYEGENLMLNDVLALSPIGNTQGFKNWVDFEETIFELRQQLIDSFLTDNLCKVYEFMGNAEFCAQFELSDSQAHYLNRNFDEMDEKDLLEAMVYEPTEIEYRYFETERYKNEFMEKAIEQCFKQYFKPLVEEVSGPGAVYEAMGGGEAFNAVYRNMSSDSPTTVPRAMELLCDAHSRCPFESDNIPAWQTSEEDLTAMNEDGLSWIPRNNTPN